MSGRGHAIKSTSSKRRTVHYGLVLGSLLLVGLLVVVKITVRHNVHLGVVSKVHMIATTQVTDSVLADHPLAAKSDETFTLILYYEKFANSQQASHFVNLAKAAIKSVEPFQSANNVYVHVLTLPEAHCTVQKKVKAILHCDEGLLKAVNTLGYRHFKLAVISPDDFVPYATVARGKNSAFYMPAYKGQLTDSELDTFFSTYFLHELGHAVGLRDEYVRQRYNEQANGTPSTVPVNGAYTAAKPNCAPDETAAVAWWGGATTQLQKGCAGHLEYFFPEAGTLMSDAPQSITYGSVSAKYIQNALRCFYAAQNGTSLEAGNDCTEFTNQYPNFWNE